MMLLAGAEGKSKSREGEDKNFYKLHCSFGSYTVWLVDSPRMEVAKLMQTSPPCKRL